MIPEAQPRDLLLRGKLVQPDGSAADRYLLVRDGTIASIGRSRPPRSDDTTYVELGPDEWVFPGLLDLHTHSSYNLYPVWDGDAVPYPNRFAWRNAADYQRDIRDLNRWFLDSGGDREAKARRQTMIAAFAELQAIAGGTTTLQESYALEAPDPLEPVLCRSTANPLDLGLAADRTVMSVVDFFRPDDDGRPAPTRNLDEYLAAREADTLAATLVHLAEGRSGLGGGQPDPYTRAEFEAFMAHPAFADADAVAASPLALIHGCGIDPDDDRHLAFLRDRDISVIWSPSSNLLLYRETIDVEKLVAGGMYVALGSDWSPSGSKHIWDEAKFAKFYLQAMGSAVSDADLFGMVTVHAARCLGTDALGRLATGAKADFFVLRSPVASDNALEVFFKTTDRDVRAVLVGGIPRYGAADFLAPFPYEWQPMPAREGSAVVDKRVHLPPNLVNEAGEPVSVGADLDRLEDLLKSKDVKRSNLLSDSDVPYRAQIRDLRKITVDYGWRVGYEKHQEWKRSQGL